MEKLWTLYYQEKVAYLYLNKLYRNYQIFCLKIFLFFYETITLAFADLSYTINFWLLTVIIWLQTITYMLLKITYWLCAILCRLLTYY